MTIEATVWAGEQALRPFPRLLLLVLADSTDCDGVAVTSRESLLRRTGMTGAELDSTFASLEAGGMISPSKDVFGAPGWRLMMREG